MTQREDLERSLSTILEPLGLRPIRRGEMAVHAAPCSDALEVRVALPPMSVDVTLERDPRHSHSPSAWSLHILKQFDTAQRKLFHGVVEHIARHDRSPLDRMKQVEAAANMLIVALGASLDDVRMPFGSSGAVSHAVYELQSLLKAKPGSPSWSTAGYGKEAP